MLRLLRWSVLAGAGLALSACATMNVSSHVEQGLDFRQYHTWQWTPADALPESDARLDNAFFRDHFQGAVERQLARRGLTQQAPGAATPDLLVHYHANIAPRIAPSHADPSSGACYDGDCTVRVMENEVGTMMIDVVDARTHRLIWRGWAQDNLDGLLDHPDRFQSHIADAVSRMFARFPRSI